LLTLTLWALVLASLVFWGMRLFAPRTGVPTTAQTPARTLAMGGELRRLLGSSEVASDDDDDALADASDRFHLLGVVAPRGAGHSPQGVALIAIGDEPPKAWRTGASLDEDTVLLAVGPRSVQLGPRGGPPTTELTLPDPAVAATGTPGMPGAPGMPRATPGPINRPAPMMPQGVQQPQPQPGAYPGGPGAQPVQRSGSADEEDNGEEEE
jgi:general secretion pathway protein C